MRLNCSCNRGAFPQRTACMMLSDMVEHSLNSDEMSMSLSPVCTTPLAISLLLRSRSSTPKNRSSVYFSPSPARPSWRPSFLMSGSAFAASSSTYCLRASKLPKMMGGGTCMGMCIM